jgi:hypothetical protein
MQFIFNLTVRRGLKYYILLIFIFFGYYAKSFTLIELLEGLNSGPYCYPSLIFVGDVDYDTATIAFSVTIGS